MRYNKHIVMTVAGIVLASGSAWAFNEPVAIVDQGSFLAGGTVMHFQDGKDDSRRMDAADQTFAGDHAYAFYQIPDRARKLSLVFLHGGLQSGKTWETTADGRDGFQNIFLEKGYKTYVIDQPRRGRAGRSTVPATLTPGPSDQYFFAQFRFGRNGTYFEGSQAVQGAAAMDQLMRQGTPDTGAFDASLIADGVSAVFDRAGDGIMVSHSAGTESAVLTAIRSEHVKGLAAFEPWNGWIFPEGEAPAVIKTSSNFGDLTPTVVSKAEFERLTQIPIVVYFGDYIPDKPVDNGNLDSWRARLQVARIWIDCINKHGGDATLVHFPEIGVTGNTHFIISDRNNDVIAGHFADWLHAKGLDSRS